MSQDYLPNMTDTIILYYVHYQLPVVHMMLVLQHSWEMGSVGILWLLKFYTEGNRLQRCVETDGKYIKITNLFLYSFHKSCMFGSHAKYCFLNEIQFQVQMVIFFCFIL